MHMYLPSTMCGPNMVNLARLYGGETDLITETFYKYGKPRFYGNGKTDLITKTWHCLCVIKIFLEDLINIIPVKFGSNCNKKSTIACLCIQLNFTRSNSKGLSKSVQAIGSSSHWHWGPRNFREKKIWFWPGTVSLPLW